MTGVRSPLVRRLCNKSSPLPSGRLISKIKRENVSAARIFVACAKVSAWVITRCAVSSARAIPWRNVLSSSKRKICSTNDSSFYFNKISVAHFFGNLERIYFADAENFRSELVCGGENVRTVGIISTEVIGR